MGISVHVYHSIDEYVLRNKNHVSPKLEVNETSLPLQDIWIKDDDKIMLVLDSKKFFVRPDVSRSITCYQKDNIDEYLTGDEKLVKYDDVSFEPKGEKIMFFKKTLRRPQIFFKVGRFWGDLPKKRTNIDWAHKFFNLKANRVDLILLTSVS
jgi:hypothetical protein